MTFFEMMDKIVLLAVFSLVLWVVMCVLIDWIDQNGKGGSAA